MYLLLLNSLPNRIAVEGSKGRAYLRIFLRASYFSLLQETYSFSFLSVFTSLIDLSFFQLFLALSYFDSSRILGN